MKEKLKFKWKSMFFQFIFVQETLWFLILCNWSFLHFWVWGIWREIWREIEVFINFFWKLRKIEMWHNRVETTIFQQSRFLRILRKENFQKILNFWSEILVNLSKIIEIYRNFIKKLRKFKKNWNSHYIPQRLTYQKAQKFPLPKKSKKPTKIQQ